MPRKRTEYAQKPKVPPSLVKAHERRRDTPLRAPARPAAFAEIAALVQSARSRTYRAANTALIDLYWKIGEAISRRIRTEKWGKSVVGQLAEYLARKLPGNRGFSASNLWRMAQFHDSYHEHPILAALLRELPWYHNLLIFGSCKIPEEREFYLRLASREEWTGRELERQIAGGLFQRTVVSPAKVSAALRKTHPTADGVFKDSYLLDFLDLPVPHSERDLQKGLVADLKRFLAELGRDFCYVGEQYPVQVGKEDFHIDLLFYHRELQCLVAFELKIGRFRPEHLGQLSFYLEALDRDVRKVHEKPSVGVLLCAGKDEEVVEYALSRSLSPALIAEYRTRLPEKDLLQRKLAEFYALETKRAR
jgi:predicted nuclease of restriction endonuclease-like (RecB) superfamily